MRCPARAFYLTREGFFFLFFRITWTTGITRSTCTGTSFICTWNAPNVDMHLKPCVEWAQAPDDIRGRSSTRQHPSCAILSSYPHTAGWSCASSRIIVSRCPFSVLSSIADISYRYNDLSGHLGVSLSPCVAYGGGAVDAVQYSAVETGGTGRAAGYSVAMREVIICELI